MITRRHPPIVSFVGKSNSGKTTFLESLIPALVLRGIVVCAIKHSHHPASPEGSGKDTDRLLRAGAAIVFFHGVDQASGIGRLEQQVAGLMENIDLVITEGYKFGPAPKIEISRAKRARELACADSMDLIAVVADYPIELEVPRFSFDQADPLADWLIKRFLSDKRKSKIAL